MSDRKMLVVDDEAAIRSSIEMNFRRSGWYVECASGVSEALLRFRSGNYDVVITDMRMQDGDGLELIRAIRRSGDDTPALLLTAYGNVPDAVTAMKQGACDFLVKPVPFEHLKAVVERVIKGSAGPQDRAQIVGSSSALLESLRKASLAARTDADVLIEAESGTGKELLARLIHEESDRCARPFVAVNCAALPEALLESELFGHRKGAFTGALSSKIGKFAQANGGTLLLDEIGEMSLSLQPKLLRALQEREIEPLGDTQSMKVNIRVVATTNRSLRRMVKLGTFRPDLYYRLNVIPLTLPPLRERTEDIAELAEYFLRKFSDPRGATPVLTREFLCGLQSYDWPGNVRQLANFMHRVTVLCTTAEIGKEYLENRIRSETPVVIHAAKPGTKLREVERTLLQATLDATHGNRTRAAEMLGVSIRTVRNKIRDYGLPRRSYA